ncbi:hypothetical protein ACJ41O_003230 [Fusarium nematophilum]
MAGNKKYLESLVSSLSSLSSLVEVYTTRDEDMSEKDETRWCAIAEAQSIIDELTPQSEKWHAQVAAMGAMTATRLFLQWRAFDMMPATGAISHGDLAKKLDADESLILGKTLVANRILEEVADGLTHTPNSLVYTNSSPYSYFFRMLFDETLVPFVSMPQYFDKYGLREPRTPNHNPYSFANNQADKTVLDILSQDPRRMRVFTQGIIAEEQLMPLRPYPQLCLRRLPLLSHADKVAIVDVAGGRGHNLKALLEDEESPEIPTARCVVQDREDVIEEARGHQDPKLKGVRFMAHDHHQEQPIKGAGLYHPRRCLHDKSDDVCVMILGHIAAAMNSKSVLVLVERVDQNYGPSKLSAHFDLAKLVVGGRERATDDLSRLVKEAGLVVRPDYSGPDDEYYGT